MPDQIADVIVVGAGNAAFCAALAAQERGAKVLMLEAAPEDEAGGNSRFTAGSIRVVYSGTDDIKTLVPDLTPAEIESTDFGTYTADEFFDDMARVTQHRADPDLVELLVTRSFDTLNWMREKGVRLIPIYGRQAFKVGGRFKFWGGLTVEAVGGGPGLVAMLTAAARQRGIEIRYRTRALDLLCDGNRVEGVRVRSDGAAQDLRAKAVVLACGGFEANAEWRTRYLGPGWDLAKVRGSRFNTGDGIRMALAIGASPRGNWSGCHAVQWEMNAPEFGDLAVGDQFQKHSYPFGILINATGQRFVDEGADFRNYTYAKYGRVVLEQPGQFAWQVFDQKVKHLLRDEYKIRQITKVAANTIEELAQKLEGVNAAAFVRTDSRMERGGAGRRPVQSEPQGWTRHAGPCGQQKQLGKHHRRAAFRSLCGHLRRHLHFRRVTHQQRWCGAQYRLPAGSRSLRRGRTCRRPVLFQLSGRHRADVGRGIRQNCRRLGRGRRRTSMSSPWPTELRLNKDRKTLAVKFDDGESFELPAEYLRVRSPSAEVQGHSPAERRVVPGKRDVQILEVHPVGNYAVRLIFDDLHSTGIFTWDYLFELGHNRENYWREYLGELKDKKLSRDPAAR